MTIFCPPPFIKVSSGGSGAVTLTLVDGGGGYGVFYTADAPNNPGGIPRGSLSGEPVAGQAMKEFTPTPVTNWVAFVGNAVAVLTGKSVWLNGVNYPFDGADWYYYGSDGHTYGEWSSGAPSTTAGAYSLEIK